MLGGNPKIKLLIELGTNKLALSLGSAKKMVTTGVSEMKAKLAEVKEGFCPGLCKPLRGKCTRAGRFPAGIG